MFLNQSNKYNDTSHQNNGGNNNNNNDVHYQHHQQQHQYQYQYNNNNNNTNNNSNNSSSTSSTSSSSSSSTGLKFPTSILENLLQNSDILETLMKPINNAEGGSDDISFEKFDEKAFAKKLEENDLTKNYGNAFLGPNLWNKSELFPSDKFNVKLEYLDVQEFLAENELNECDFLDELQNFDPKNLSLTSTSTPINTTTTTTTNSNNDNNKNILPPLPQQQQQQTLVIPPVIKQQISNNTNNTESNGSSSTVDFNFGNTNDDLRDFIMNSTSCNTSYKRRINRDLDTSDDMTSDDNDSCIDFLDDDDEESMLNDEQLFAKISTMTGEELLAYRKSRKQFVPNELKDEKYWNRRRKNNLAAKRSRDARRLKETQIALRAAFLERENSNLRRQLDECKRETRILKTRLSRYEKKE